jgi:hypothetical protein
MVKLIRLVILMLAGAAAGYILIPWTFAGYTRVTGEMIAVRTTVCEIMGAMAGIGLEVLFRLAGYLARKTREMRPTD